MSDESPLKIAERLAGSLRETAVARDRAGGTPKHERELFRQSGLLRLVVPEALGGFGASWTTALQTVRIIAREDASLAHVFGFQHLMLATVQLFGSDEQWRRLAAQTAKNDWFWGNALNPQDTRSSIVRQGPDWVIRGAKSFASGSADADMLIVSALREDGRLAVAAVPSSREGIVVKHDWDNMGQRQTDSGTVEFHDVKVLGSELLETPGPLGSVYASLRPCIAQLTFSNIFVGIAEGTLAHGKEQLLRKSQSGGKQVAPEPYAIQLLGELWLGNESARLLCERAAAELDQAYALGDALAAEQRGALSIAIAAAKVATTRAGLDVTNRIFELIGARGTSSRLGFDRFWRNLRTLTLHDPIDAKLRALGGFALDGQLPIPSFYS